MKAKPSGRKTVKTISLRQRKPRAKPTESIDPQTHPDTAGFDADAEEFVIYVPTNR